MADTQRLVAELRLQSRQFDDGIGRATRKLSGFERATTRTGNKLRGIVRDPALKSSILQGVGLGGGLLGFQALSVGISTAVDQMGQAIDAASDLEESQSKVDAVFDTQAGTVRRWARTLDAAFGLTQRAALESAGTLGNFLQALGQTEQDAARVSRDIVELAGDLASFNNIPVPDILVALQSGLAGESEPVRRLGIDISAARIEAELLERGVRKVNGQFSQSEKVLGRYLAIMKDTEKAQGDAARTADTLAGRQRQLDARLGGLRARIGGAVLPVVNEFAGALLDVVDTAEKAADGLGVLIDTLPDLQGGLQGAQKELQGFGDDVGDIVGRDLINDFTNFGRVLLTGGIILIPDAIGKAGDAMEDLEDDTGGLLRKVSDANREFMSFNRAVEQAVPPVGNLLERVSDANAGFREFNKGLRASKERVIDLGDAIRFAADTSFKDIQDEAKKAQRAIEQAFGGRDPELKSTQALQKEEDKLVQQRRKAIREDNTAAFRRITLRLREVREALRFQEAERRFFRDQLQAARENIRLRRQQNRERQRAVDLEEKLLDRARRVNDAAFGPGAGRALERTGGVGGNAQNELAVTVNAPVTIAATEVGRATGKVSRTHRDRVNVR